MGIAYEKLAQYKKAIHSYEEAIKINPKDGDAYYNIGVAYDKLEQYEKALQFVNKAIEINPEFAGAYHSRANIKGEIGDYSGASEDMFMSEQLYNITDNAMNLMDDENDKS